VPCTGDYLKTRALSRLSNFVSNGHRPPWRDIDVTTGVPQTAAGKCGAACGRCQAKGANPQPPGVETTNSTNYDSLDDARALR